MYDDYVLHKYLVRLLISESNKGHMTNSYDGFFLGGGAFSYKNAKSVNKIVFVNI